MVSAVTRQKLDALNAWLADVYGEGIRLSQLLQNSGLAEEAIEIIKSQYLEMYIDAVSDVIQISNTPDKKIHELMINYYGLLDGQPESVASLCEKYTLPESQIRSMIKGHIHLFQTDDRKDIFRFEIAQIGRRLLINDLPDDPDEELPERRTQLEISRHHREHFWNGVTQKIGNYDDSISMANQ